MSGRTTLVPDPLLIFRVGLATPDYPRLPLTTPIFKELKRSTLTKAVTATLLHTRLTAAARSDSQEH